MSATSDLTSDDYTVAWIAPLEVELIAARLMLDERHEKLPQSPIDHNIYTLGSIGSHNIVIASLPTTGNTSAATVITQLRNTFKRIRFGLLVGIGGGVPVRTDNGYIHLGDVVVSKPCGDHSGAIQYDHGKAMAREFRRTGYLTPPPTVLLNAAQELSAEQAERDECLIWPHLQNINTNIRGLRKHRFPGQDQDHLFRPDYQHVQAGVSCQRCGCDSTRIISDRGASDSEDEGEEDDDRSCRIVVHRGTIAAGEQVIKDGQLRDQLAQTYGALCFEMEAAGVLNDFPCLVIRGISDYADSHKNDKWHGYAAATAAAYARQLFFHMPVDMVKECKVGLKAVADELGNITSALTKQIEYSQEQQNHNQKANDRYLSDRERECHQAFAPFQSYEQQKNINPDRLAGTCQWVLSHQKYITWYESASCDLLWISADPGCGKSVLARSLVDHELCSIDSRAVCYFFFKDNEDQNSLAVALCALLHQLFGQQHHLIKYALDAWNEYGSKLRQEIDQMWRILLTATADRNACSVVCVLDALDECRSQDRVELAARLSAFYTNTKEDNKTQSQLKFLVTSRLYSDIQYEFGRIPLYLPIIHLKGDEMNDIIHREIDIVVRARVDDVVKSLDTDDRERKEVKDRLEQRLLTMKHRTYLWLYLAIEGIQEAYAKSLRPSEHSLDLLPTSVEDAYEKILSKITVSERGHAEMILRIILGARRPLTLSEMGIALGIGTKPDAQTIVQGRLPLVGLKDKICKLCGLFVVFNDSRIYLLHQTAKEFLVGTTMSNDHSWKHCLGPYQTEETMARVCVQFLSLSDLQNIKDNAETESNFLGYSAEYWADHVRDILPCSDTKLLNHLYQLYDTSSQNFAVWSPLFRDKTYVISPDMPPLMPPLHLAAFNGHHTVVEWILMNGNINLEATDRAKRTALTWAAERGHEAALSILLQHGADVNISGGRYGTALRAASLGGHEDVVQLLLNHGAEVNMLSGRYSTALQAASLGGHEDVVQLLLNYGAKVNMLSGRYGTALQAASLNGHEDVVQLLLNYGAKVNMLSGRYGTALQAASSGGHEDVVQLLLNHGAEVNAQSDGAYRTALQAASSEGHEDVVQLLLNHGAEINISGGYGTALRAASLNGHQDIVQLLLDHNADVNERGYWNDTPLITAAEKGHIDIVQLLLNHGAKVNTQAGHSGTALIAAAEKGHIDIVQLLLTHGAEVNTQTKAYDGTALIAAAREGRQYIVQLLLDHGANINISGGRYGNALAAAIHEGHQAVVQLLLDHGANINALDYSNDTALTVATREGHQAIVQLLLDHGAHPTTEEELYT